jgi:hypothetical protein
MCNYLVSQIFFEKNLFGIFPSEIVALEDHSKIAARVTACICVDNL